jgi:hypothetical protein
MAKLTAKKRNSLKASQFAGPDRSFPVNDKSHARNAKARASQAVNAGRMSSSERAKIDAKADRVLGKSPKESAMKKHHEGRKHEGKKHEGKRHGETKRREKEHHERVHAEPKGHKAAHHEAHSRGSHYADHPSAHEHMAKAQAAMNGISDLGRGFDK